MKYNVNNDQFDIDFFEEIDIDELIYQIDESFDFKLFKVKESNDESTIIIKIFKKGKK